MKTSELTGPALDWAVAKCEGNEINIRSGFLWIPTECFSTDWSQGGPIIEREGVSISKEPRMWTATIDLDEGDVMVETKYGPTPLIAAMRCYVTSKLGDEVEIPEELK